MKKSDVLKQQRTALHAKILPLTEKEELTPEERSTLDGYHTENDDLEANIKLEERNEAFLKSQGKGVDVQHGTEDKRSIEEKAASFSFTKAIREFHAGGVNSLTGVEREMHDLAVEERKAQGQPTNGLGIPSIAIQRAATGQNVSVAADGGNLVQDHAMVFVEKLQNALVLVGLGAKFVTGLVGDLPLVKGGSFAATWIGGDNDDVDENPTKASYGKTTLSPKNIVAIGVLSKQLLAQTSPSVESMIQDDIAMAIAQGIMSGVLLGATNGPLGVINESGINALSCGTDGGPLTFAKMVELETAVGESNALLGNLGLVTNSKVRGALKTTVKADNNGSGFIWANNEVNGYPATVSNVIPSTYTKGTGTGLSAAIFGNWSDLLIGMWGGLDLLVDPYTRGGVQEVRIIVNQFVNATALNAKSFAVLKDIKA